MSTAQNDHPHMPLSERVPLVAAFALRHTADGFTNRMLAEELNCSETVAGYTRLELEHKLASSPIQLSLDMRVRPGNPPGWKRIDPDNTHHDVRLYCLQSA